MTNTPRIGAGFKHIFYGFMDSTGYLLGGTATAPAAGLQAGAVVTRLEGAQTVPIGLPETERLIVSGDDGPLVQFSFEPDALPSGVLELAVRNSAFEALAQNTKVQDIGDLSIGLLGVSTVKPSMLMIFSRRAKTWAPGQRGGKAWETLLAPVTEVEPLGPAQYQSKAASSYRYGLSVSKASSMPSGTALNAADNGASAASLIPVDSDYPLMFQRWTLDGVETEFTLNVPPVSNSKIYVWKNGTLLALTTDYTVNLVTPSISLVAAGTTGDVLVAFIETEESNLE